MEASLTEPSEFIQRGRSIHPAALRLCDGATLDEKLTRAIKTKIRTGASPRHVPARVVQVADIPRIKSGKITELAVRDIVHGREVKNVEALANPEALEMFKNLPELRS
jgi:acetoacetyl-CoA synthetase